MSLAEDLEYWSYSYPDEDYYDESIFKQYLLNQLQWVCKDGRKKFISCMTTEHINNIMRIPSYPNKDNWDIIFEYELRRRK